MHARARVRTRPRIVRPGASEKRRFWLAFPRRLLRRPVVYELGRKFRLVTNIRQASVTGELGIVCLELEGSPEEIRRAIRWLERLRVNVEPVEVNVVAR